MFVRRIWSSPDRNAVVCYREDGSTIFVEPESDLWSFVVNDYVEDYVPPPPPSISDVRMMAFREGETLLSRAVHTVCPAWKAPIHQRKLEAAASGDETDPLIISEAAVRATTTREVIQSIIARANESSRTIQKLEMARIQFKSEVESVANAEEAMTAVERLRLRLEDITKGE